MASLIFGAIFTLAVLFNIRYVGESRFRNRQLVAAQAALHNQVETLDSRCQYDSLESLEGNQRIVQDGFPFELVT